MLGQENLVEKIKRYSLDEFPHTLLLEGNKGSGKHMLLDIISNHLKLPLLEITDKLDLESISGYYLRSEPYIYIIDSDKISIKNQYSILKFIEEPLNNSFIILLTSNRYKLLDTIRNRCRILAMNKYTKDVLSDIFPDVDPKIISFCETPGDVLILKNFDLIKEEEFVEKVIYKSDIANFSNMFKISEHIALNNETDKLPLPIFFKLLKMKILLDIKIEDNSNLFKKYIIVEEYFNKSFLPNIDNKYLLDNFLINFWRSSRQ